ncbi:uncharacterized protein LOC34624359 [Cyclospora cayetanensis]|uniref:Uncharacterized protein LOC34624359 n=1 Tax=Cyclospora cayetanensis TaxID=88456 RepID=A0A6P6S0D5_9EIME|nr:uncharacterized protein LOC34624359 [Cyclospora cayetanensis]
MNFCLSTVDTYLQQQRGAPGSASDEKPTSEGSSSAALGVAAGPPSSPPLASADGCSTSATSSNSLKSLLQLIAGVAAAAQKIPVGDDYTIQTGSNSNARRAAEAAAADTLRALIDVSSGCAGGALSLAPLRRAEALYRDLADPSASISCSNNLTSTSNSTSNSASNSGFLQKDGQQIHEGIGSGVQALLDDLLEAVDASLEAHRQNPQQKIRMRLAPSGQPPSQQQEQQDTLQQQRRQKQKRITSGTSPLVQQLKGSDGSRESLLTQLEGRPQSQWAFLIDNYSKLFVPRMQQKPHGRYPLSEATLTAQRRRALWIERRKDIMEDALAAAAAEFSPGRTQKEQQQQLLLLKQRDQALLRLQQEEEAEREAESTEPLPHPYEGELKDLEWLLDNDLLQQGVYADFFSMKEPPVAPPTEETPLVIVETPRQLREMLDELCSGRHRVVALDTEHHSYESYKGFVCLLQLSTCTSAGAPKDFLVDPFSLFYELTQLNRLTADPKILKVMHGATSDVLWLQRDFSVYFVNVFDTAVAARTLTIPGGASLANLLSFYLKKRKDTKMQLADWRIRPLSDEMKNYGRSDTHYLPYLYQCMQNQLLSRDDETGIYTLRCTTPHDLGTPTASGRAAVLGVLQRSRNICLSLYTEGPFDAEAEAAQMLRRNNTALAPLSVAVLKGLLAWRDSVARKRDVSPHAVLPNACVLLLAQRRPLEHVHLRHAIRPTPAAIHRYGPEILKAIQSQETLQPIKQQRSQEEDQAGEDDAAELLPSAEVLRGAAADQEGLLDAETVPASAPSLQDTLVGDKDSQRFFKGLEDVSNGSSNESNTPGSSSDKACQPQQLPVRVGGFFSGGAEALKSPVVIRISSAVLSHRMQDVEFRKRVSCSPYLGLPATSMVASLFCALTGMPHKFRLPWLSGLLGVSSVAVGAAASPSFADVSRFASANATAAGGAARAAQLRGRLSSKCSVLSVLLLWLSQAYIPTRMARQVARWVYSQLQQMERDQLLHSRSKRRRDELLQAPAEQPQTGRTTSSEFLLLPAYPPPPPPPEAVPTAAAAAVASGLTSVDAATTSVATAAGPVDSAVRPTNGEKETPNDTEGKCPLSGGPDLALGLVTIAQQKWKRRKRQRTRTATAAAAPAVLAQNPTPGF